MVVANQLRAEAIALRQDVMYETVMSHPSTIAELLLAKRAGYHIAVLLVATDGPGVNVKRVRIRVAALGHDVPEDHIRARYTRKLALAPAAITLADHAFVFDNTSSGETGLGLSQQAVLSGRRLIQVREKTPPWMVRLIDQINNNAAAITTNPTSSPPKTSTTHPPPARCSNRKT